ncbi:MAG: carboxylesterase family protein [Firmicutes bacterium]|nr:carboxylesterase family protein [Bacillota bacterium]
MAHSGSVNLTFSRDDFKTVGDRYGAEQTAGKSQAQILMDVSGAKNMDDLMAISEEDMIRYLCDETVDEWEDTITDYYNFPLRGDGSIIPEDPYQAIADGVNKDVDFITGTNADEWRYWVDEMGPEAVVGQGDADAVAENLEAYKEAIAQVKYDEAMAAAANDDEKAAVDKILELSGETDLWWQQTEIGNETGFRIPSIVCAQNHAKAGGTSYMYYFEKKSDSEEWLGACHASETAYVFHNLTGAGFSGTMDEGLADNMCAAWVSFATDGNPSTDAAEWTAYDENDRATMIFGDDGSLKMENDPLGEQRELMEPFAYYYLK